jgi:hypothetical protein
MSSVDGWGALWRWPLRSPRRFFSCVAALLALVALSNIILGGGGSLPPADQPAAAPSSTAAEPAPTDTASTTPIEAPPPAAVPGSAATGVTPTATPRPAASDGAQKAAATALAFTQAWADHARPAAQWLAAVSRYADPEFAAQLRSTDPANVPASKVTGAPHPVAVYFASASVEVPTDAGTVVVALVSDGRTWRVVDIHPKQ